MLKHTTNIKRPHRLNENATGSEQCINCEFLPCKNGYLNSFLQLDESHIVVVELVHTLAFSGINVVFWVYVEVSNFFYCETKSYLVYYYQNGYQKDLKQNGQQ